MSEYRVECDYNGIKWNVKYLKDGLGVSLAKDNISLDIIEIPEQLAEQPVIALLEKAFYNNKSIKDIRMPDTITTIGEGAFFNCENLEKVNIPENVKELPKWCFAYCKKLKELNGLDHIISFEAYAFYMALNMPKLVLEQEINFIGYYAFSECYIEKLYIGNIMQAGKMSFARCDCLREVYFSNDARAVPVYCFFGCQNLEKVSLNYVTAIGEYAFGKCNSLKKLKFPASLTKIGTNILFSNQMKSIIVSEKYENMTFGEDSTAEYIVRPTVSVVLKYNESRWKDEARKVYYGEQIGMIPLLETTCKAMTGWYENSAQEKLSDEFMEFLTSKYGMWFKKVYEATLQPYDFEKPVYSDITLYAQWRVKEDEAEKLY